MMEYKGYTGQITAVDEKQGLIHGRVAGITDVITFEGGSLEDLMQAFHDSVDDYVDFCGARKESPEKPLSGKFLLRISSELHKQASLAAKKSGASLNAWVASAIETQIRQDRRKPKGRTNGAEREYEDVDVKTLLGLLELRLLRELRERGDPAAGEELRLSENPA
jgi:predicted HicB family RNase H-like nuclease